MVRWWAFAYPARTRTVLSRAECPGSEANHSPSSVEIKNAWCLITIRVQNQLAKQTLIAVNIISQCQTHLKSALLKTASTDKLNYARTQILHYFRNIKGTKVSNWGSSGGTHSGKEMQTKFCSKYTNETDHLEDAGVDESIILKRISR